MGVELNDRGWPLLVASPSEPCAVAHPDSERVCVLGIHGGYHRNAEGVEWLVQEA